ncbi:hypothetical protein ASPZODRAFT_149630 [Penicilliopsis zonata CBS 506.65]|uniref:Uncharacterized protein n=1 Tax=Penicilliopsis zonata CBS 506.65 TaxID=1073090 RepID=A0A1L9SSU5_9EURO|nr:hypothetical protein ASPZODRAFT_149630 [Penicilliopsis zonata CBS 506.65]OJJ50265.1 hypothetical protein ASPZODRAFT_149630 [Penicilliopsis zonata CBS 506.65]
MTAIISAQSTSEEVCDAFSSHIKGSRVIITGVTLGSIGGEVALQLARRDPAMIALAGRKLASLQETQQAIRSVAPDIEIKLLMLELASQTLINSAGVMAAPYKATPEGVEIQFATNHLGRFLFTNLILPLMLTASSTVQIVNVSSLGHKRGPVRFDDIAFEGGKTYDKWKAYGQSKTVNMLYLDELAARLGHRGVKSISLSPGRLYTGIMRHVSKNEMRKCDGKLILDPKLNWRTLTQGAATIINAAYNPSLFGRQKWIHGSYMVNNPVQMDQAESYAVDPRNAERLWSLSENMVGQRFVY